MKKILILPLELLSRELDSKLYLTLKLLSQSINNWEVILGHYQKLAKYWNKGNAKPFVFIANGIENDERFYMKLFQNGGRFALLDEEGGIFTKYISEKYPRAGFDHQCVKYIDRVFFWGDSEKENWCDRHVHMENGQGITTGNPRFDLSKPQWANYYRTIS